MPYSVTLHRFESLEAEDQRAAETRYRSALEDAFGTTEQVVAAIKAWQAATSCDAAGAGQHDRALAARFFRVTVSARRAALRRAGDPAEAYFEVSLTR